MSLSPFWNGEPLCRAMRRARIRSILIFRMGIWAVHITMSGIFDLAQICFCISALDKNEIERFHIRFKISFCNLLDSILVSVLTN